MTDLENGRARADVAETPNRDTQDDREPGGLQGTEGQRQHRTDVMLRMQCVKARVGG